MRISIHRNYCTKYGFFYGSLHNYIGFSIANLRIFFVSNLCDVEILSGSWSTLFMVNTFLRWKFKGDLCMLVNTVLKLGEEAKC
jgi:hypothetical protein